MQRPDDRMRQSGGSAIAVQERRERERQRSRIGLESPECTDNLGEGAVMTIHLDCASLPTESFGLLLILYDPHARRRALARSGLRLVHDPRAAVDFDPSIHGAFWTPLVD
jgi:hypothetical protein